MYMGDRWNPKNIGESRYIWLPLTMEDGQPVIKWEKHWNLSFFNR
jgi:beta-galactosidase